MWQNARFSSTNAPRRPLGRVVAILRCGAFGTVLQVRLRPPAPFRHLLSKRITSSQLKSFAGTTASRPRSLVMAGYRPRTISTPKPSSKLRVSRRSASSSWQTQRILIALSPAAKARSNLQQAPRLHAADHAGRSDDTWAPSGLAGSAAKWLSTSLRCTVVIRWFDRSCGRCATRE